MGELWAVSFDAETGQHVAVKSAVPLTQCTFSPAAFSVRVADQAHLEAATALGAASTNGHTIAWDLAFHGGTEPLLLLPPRLYGTRLPSAKSLVPMPLAHFTGQLTVDGRATAIRDWLGSQNHNWGSRHTDHYAWGQVAGFDGFSESFLEVATARVKLGPLWTPPMTLLVLRHREQEIALNGLRQSLRARAALRYFTWQFHSADDRYAVTGTISAPPETFVGLRYPNPPGGAKHCLNSKLGDCELRISDLRSGRTDVLHAHHRAAFEILTDDRAHGVPIRV